jgi:hypothetical protein
MSRSLGKNLPESLAGLFDGSNLPSKAHVAALLNSVDASGRPHPAMLSVGEVLARGSDSLRLALYATSTTTRNLRTNGGLSLALAADGLAYYVKATAREIPGSADLAGLAVFDAPIDEVLEDGEAIAVVKSGFTIELTANADRTVSHWQRVIGALVTLP